MNKLLKKLRRSLHQFPELSGKEKETSKRIINFISNFNPTKIISRIGGYGLAAIYEFGPAGPTILIRCELDALPIQEKNAFDYKSVVPGVSHKCGHDGHMTMVAGLAPWLQSASFIRGKVILLFQPAEETGHGAQAMIADEKWKNISFDYAFSLHNIPGYPLGNVLIVDNTFNATVQSLMILLKGKTAHAAEPEKGINPAECCAQLIYEITALNSPDPSSKHFRLVTVVHVNIGEKNYGISAGNGELHLTIRTWGIEEMDKLVSNIKNKVDKICKDHHIDHEYSWFDYFPAVRNNDECNSIVKAAAASAGIDHIVLKSPIKFGEDYGWFSQLAPSAMFGLGSGIDTPPLHQDDYDFPDELITIGIEVYKNIISKIL